MQFQTLNIEQVPATVQTARFAGRSGVEEVHLIVRPTASGSSADQLDWLLRASAEGLAAIGLHPGTALLRRFFCSDLHNQAPLLASRLRTEPGSPADPCAVSAVEQAPAGSARIALWSYHVHDPRAPLDRTWDGQTLTLQRNGLAHHWTTGTTQRRTGGPSPLQDNGALGQTLGILADYQALLRERGLSLADNVLRTWFYLRDIDRDYIAFAQARREFFAEQGLTAETHYIASTGIAGAGTDPTAAVRMDAYALEGLRPAQIEFIRVPEQLCPTSLYGVTFERATAVSYRDRRHLFISGTASIDHCGDVVHPGDLDGQLLRTFENIEVLLRQGGARPEHLGVLIAYVRDPGDAAAVQDALQARYPGVPQVVVVAPLCRPTWLVEIEGQAILAADHSALPAF